MTSTAAVPRNAGRFRLGWIAVILGCAGSALADDEFRLARLFTDHLVLQQGVPFPVWGRGRPGDTVAVELGGSRATTQVGQEGRWRVELPARAAGGPLSLTARASREIVLHDVFVGEVWLASGQSNMQFVLSRSTGGKQAAAAANLPLVRFLEIAPDVSREPLAELPDGRWEICTPERAGGFSAVAFHFARALQAAHGGAVGIVSAPYSGTPIEAWMSRTALEAHPDYREAMAALRRSTEDWGEVKRTADRIAAERERLVAAAEGGVRAGAHRPDFDDHAWRTVDYPAEAGAMGLAEHAFAWLRKEVEVPETSAGQDLTLTLGQTFEEDRTYFNGEEIGSRRWEGLRRYVVPARLVRPGRNVIAVRLYSEWGMGRLGSRADVPTLTGATPELSVSLAGQWKFHAALESSLPDERYVQREPTALYNAMIAPLAPYPVKGVLWYQGEGNTDRPERYADLLTRLMADWRSAWRMPALPFLVVQLPNLDPRDGGTWAEFRAAQAEAARDPHSGLVVTLDVGEPFNIHPADKQPVGERLFHLADRIAYGNPSAPLSPILTRVSPEGASVRLSFAGAESGLVLRPGVLGASGFELRAREGEYRPACASVDGDSIVLTAPGVPEPVAARYAWAPNPPVTLFNGAGLPAAPFDTARER